MLGANVTGFVLGTVLFAMFLLLTLYMQLVLNMSPLETGFGYLAVAGTAIIWANVSAVLVNRVGVKPVMLVGMALLSVGLLLFTQVSVDGSYWTDLFPGFLVIGLGMPFVFVPVTIAAVAGVSHDQAGLASGLINTSQQIGGALGIAVLSAIATSATSDAIAGGTAQPQALVDGFTRAFWVAAIAAAVGVGAIAVVRATQRARAGARAGGRAGARHGRLTWPAPATAMRWQAPGVVLAWPYDHACVAADRDRARRRGLQLALRRGGWDRDRPAPRRSSRASRRVRQPRPLLGAIVITAVAGVTLYALRGEVQVGYALLVGVPGAIGALAGTALQQRSREGCSRSGSPRCSS